MRRPGGRDCCAGPGCNQTAHIALVKAVVRVVLIWLVAFDPGADLLGTDRGAGGFGGLTAATLLTLAGSVAVLGALLYGWPVVIAATPLVILAWPGVAAHTWSSAAIVVMAVAFVTAMSRLSSPAPAPR